MSRSFERPALLSARNGGVNAILPPLDCVDVFGESSGAYQAVEFSVKPQGGMEPPTCASLRPAMSAKTNRGLSPRPQGLALRTGGSGGG